MQAIALKTIFGWNLSYRQCLQLADLEPLETRRKNLCLTFAKKTEANPRFQHWFPPADEIPYNLRRTERIQINFARHERLKNSPIYYMRRLLNDEEPEREVSFTDLDG